VRGLRIHGLDPQQFEVLLDFSTDRQLPVKMQVFKMKLSHYKNFINKYFIENFIKNLMKFI